MTTYWKSLPRYYCKYCNFWCVDNKINIQKHESSEIHRANLDRYLTKQKITREREAAREKEVEKIIKKAENDALESMNKTASGNKKVTSKKNAYYMNSYPSMNITYDTVPTPEQWQASLNNTAPVVYNENMGNIPPPPPVGSGPVVYNESTSNIPPPPPVGSGPVVYNESTSNIPPPPPVGSGPVVYNESTSNIPPPPPSDQPTQPPIKYNFDYESKLTEEDLFGSWKTVSVTQLTEQDLAKREEQYDKEVMKSSKQPIKKGVKQVKKVKKEEESEDEDEKDAFDMFNPFGGKYKGVDLSASDPVFNPTKKSENQKKIVEEVPQEKKESNSKPEPEQFISTNISFSFAPKKSNIEKKELKPKASAVSSFFSYACFFYYP